MAYLITKSADINILDANGWNTVETGSGAIELTISSAISTTTSYVYSTNGFTGTNTNVCDGLLLKCYRNTTTGTVTVALSEDGGTTATREVTVNASDLPADESWVFFKFGSSLTLDGGTDYKVGIKASSSSNATFRSNSLNSYLRLLRLTTTATAAAGDVLYVAGDHTGAGATTSRVVTWDDTASTDFGTGTAGSVNNGIEIGDAGTVTAATAGSTNYTMKCSGILNVWGGGTLSLGTTGTPVPRTSTFTLTFDCGANVEFGLIVNNGGTWNSQGLSRTSGKNIVSCLLNTDEAADSTSLGVDTDTGWLDNDEIAVASTTRTATQCEKGTLNGAAGASTLTVDGFAGTGGGLLNAHGGTSPVQAEVILLTRNVKIAGASATLQGYVDIKATAIVDIDWTEFYWLGSATSGKRGIGIATTTGTCNIAYSSLHDFEVTSSIGLSVTGSSGSGFSADYIVTYSIASNHFATSATTGTWSLTNSIFLLNTASAIILLNDVAGTFTDCTVAGCAGASSSAAIDFNQAGGSSEGFTFSNINIHSCGSTGLDLSSCANITFSNLKIWRNGGTGITATSATNLVFDTVELFGNTSYNILPAAVASGFLDCKFINLISDGDSTFSTTTAVNANSANQYYVNCEFINCEFSNGTGIKTAHTTDISLTTAAGAVMNFNNCIFGASTEVTTGSFGAVKNGVFSQKHDKTAGNHKTLKRYGTITTDTTIYKTNSPSQRLTPNSASNKLVSGSFKVNVANGETCTPTVYVRESVSGDGTDYNGNRIRLILKRNDAIGITADTVIDTATASSEGGWEGLTGTTAAATDDGVMEFIVDCDGTTGWMNIDDITASVA